MLQRNQRRTNDFGKVNTEPLILQDETLALCRSPALEWRHVTPDQDR
jgi:hypothetical protein